MPRLVLISRDAPGRQTWRRWLSEATEPAFEIVEATSHEDVLALLQDRTPEIILLDVAPPDAGQHDFLLTLRQHDTPPPVVLLAGNEHEPLLDTLEPLADDVLSRDSLTPRLLRRTSTRLVEQFRLRNERDRALAENQRLEEKLEQVYRDHDRFLSGKSHDLRSPINAAIGYSELLIEELEDRRLDDLKDDVQRIWTVSRRLLEIVADLTQPADPSAAVEEPVFAPARPYEGELEDRPDEALLRTALEKRTEDAPPASVATHGPVLIIDDDAELRGLMARFLGKQGYQVVTAEDGEEGLRLARSLRPAVITLDVVMPGMDGWVVLSALKSDPDLARTPVIILTGRGSERIAAHALRQGVDDYLIKGDISAAALRRAVQGVMEKDRLRREVEKARNALLQANEALSRSERRYRLLAVHASDMISRLTLEGVYLYASPASRGLFGYEPEELVGRSAYDFFNREDTEAFEHVQAAAVEDKSAYTVSYRFRKKDGTYRWVETRAQRVAGELEDEIVAVTRDITERVQAEQRLEALNETLEERVEAQTAQIRALATSLTLAEQRERQRIAQILHDGLQQHLYGLNMRVQLLARKVRALASVAPTAVQDQFKQLMRMTDEAIGMTRTLSVELSPPALKDESLTSVMEWLSLRMKEVHGLDVTLEALHPCPVPGKEMRVLLFQLVRELLFNTVKHAGVDQAKVILQRTDSHLRIDVIDEGQGFDVNALHRAPSTQSGWGLASMAERLSLFNGSLETRSAPGQGTCMILRVPCEALQSDAGKGVQPSPERLVHSIQS